MSERLDRRNAAPAQARNGPSRRKAPISSHRIWASLPYDSISLERQGCFGPCPIYAVKFSRSNGIDAGPAEFQGDAWVQREGAFEGGISIWDYGRLCELLDGLHFLELEENYSANWTDDETVVVEARVATETYRVLDYGHQGPPELVALQLAIDAITQRVEWRLIGPSNTPGD